VTAPKKPASRERVMQVKDPSLEKGELKAFAGSRSDDFNRVLLSEVANTLWTKHSSQEWQAQQLAAVAGGLRGIEPKDELEGMLAAQALAAHHAAMECYRRAMLPDQSFEVWKEQINQANKLSRTYATLVEALNRHRGKGQSTSNMSMFMPAGRPSSALWRPAAGTRAKIGSNPMQKPFAMHLSPRCGARTRSGRPCRSPAMPNGRCRLHGGASPGAPKGKANGNYRHGRFTQEAIERRRELNALIRLLRRTAEELE
jgi:hypothetical protein